MKKLILAAVIAGTSTCVQAQSTTGDYIFKSTNGNNILNINDGQASSVSSYNDVIFGTQNAPAYLQINGTSSGWGWPGGGYSFPMIDLRGTGTASGNILWLGVSNHGGWIGDSRSYSSPVNPGDEYKLTLKANVLISPSRTYTHLFDIVQDGGINILDIDNDKSVFSNVVGIGTSVFPTTGPFKLYVSGGIRTEKVKVDIAAANGWGDFVFDDSYDLQSLDSVEAYIEENKHLPNIPSAKEIHSNGVDLGEMQRLQMIKIEELTLHMIDLKKQNDLLQAQLESMRLMLPVNGDKGGIHSDEIVIEAQDEKVLLDQELEKL